MDDGERGWTRRDVLAGSAASGALALSGCSERLLSRVEHSPPEQVSMTVKAPIRDDDGMATRIATHFVDNLEAAGIDVALETKYNNEVYRDVLLNGSYDAFVLRHPGFDEPDALRSFLHSEYIAERGWQNPFGFTDRQLDELLVQQSRASGEERSDTLEELLQELLAEAPFAAVVFPDHITVSRPEFPHDGVVHTADDYRSLLEYTVDSGDDARSLRIGIVGFGPAESLNPLNIEFIESFVLVDLLYDPLVRNGGDGDVPWLAEDVSWNEEDGETSATVTLRQGARWHDQRSIRAEDVAFTYRFLNDTSLGQIEDGLPAPTYRGRTSLVEHVEAVGSRTVEFSFGERSAEVASRALTVPILPAGVWEPRSELVEDYLTEALVWENTSPVGSGLLRFVDSSTNEFVDLEPFHEHPLFDDEVLSLPESDRLRYDRFEFRVLPNPGTAIGDLQEGGIDVIGTSLSPPELDLIDDDVDVRITSRSTTSFYLIGFNVRAEELSNPHFRSLVAQLVDRSFVAEEFFEGFARPATTRHAFSGLSPNGWDDDADVTDFPGVDGEIDRDVVRERFRAINYRYTDDELVSR